MAHHKIKEAGEIQSRLERIKWRPWHGDAHEALIRIADLVEALKVLESNYSNLGRLTKSAAEFATYSCNNRAIIPDYGERWCNDEPISSAFVESTVNVVINRRFAKKQQMRWSRASAHRMVQIRTQTLDGTQRGAFSAWYPEMTANDTMVPAVANVG